MIKKAREEEQLSKLEACSFGSRDLEQRAFTRSCAFAACRALISSRVLDPLSPERLVPRRPDRQRLLRPRCRDGPRNDNRGSRVLDQPGAADYVDVRMLLALHCIPAEVRQHAK